MGMKRQRLTGLLSAVLLSIVLPGGTASAHGGGNWDPFTIDGVNDRARVEVLKVQALISEVIRGRAGADTWPVAGLSELRDALITVKEEVDEILEHYLIDGVNVQLLAALHEEPRAGRTVAASRALDAGIAILDHAASRENADAFVSEFYAAGMAARLFELLEANVDRLDLYAALTAVAE